MDVLDLQSKVAQWFPPSQSVAKLDQNQIQIEVKILNNRKKNQAILPAKQTVLQRGKDMSVQESIKMEGIFSLKIRKKDLPGLFVWLVHKTV